MADTRSTPFTDAFVRYCTAGHVPVFVSAYVLGIGYFSISLVVAAIAFLPVVVSKEYQAIYKKESWLRKHTIIIFSLGLGTALLSRLSNDFVLVLLLWSFGIAVVMTIVNYDKAKLCAERFERE